MKTCDVWWQWCDLIQTEWCVLVLWKKPNAILDWIMNDPSYICVCMFRWSIPHSQTLGGVSVCETWLRELLMLRKMSRSWINSWTRHCWRGRQCRRKYHFISLFQACEGAACVLHAAFDLKCWIHIRSDLIRLCDAHFIPWWFVSWWRKHEQGAIWEHVDSRLSY